MAPGDFTRHPLRPLAAAKSLIMHAAQLRQAAKQASLAIFTHLNEPLLTENELRQRMEAGDESIFQALLSLMGNVPGTCGYWKKFSNDITARERVAHALPQSSTASAGEEAPSAQQAPWIAGASPTRTCAQARRAGRPIRAPARSSNSAPSWGLRMSRGSPTTGTGHWRPRRMKRRPNAFVAPPPVSESEEDEDASTL